MNNPEKFRGQTNSIILFVLLSGDRHTDELKEIIDSRFSEVKIGTLYSIISRMKTQGYIAEYRASSNDGSRRKYYKITDSGRKLYDSEYAHLFEYESPIVDAEVETTKQTVQDDENENVYLKYVKKAESSDFSGDIDFSNVVIDEDEPAQETTPTTETQEPEIEYAITEQNVVNSDVIEPEGVDYDSLVRSNYEYKSVLNKLFPKENKVYVETETNIETEIKQQDKPADFTDIYEFSEKENIKIRTSGDTNRYQGTKILANKLRFHSAIVTLLVAILEYFALTLIFSGSVEFSSATLGKIALIFGIFAVVMGIVYILNTSYSVKDLPKFINALEIALILTISIAIISFAVASIKSVDYHDTAAIFDNIILPCVMSANIPLYTAIVQILSKLEFYQSI